MRSGRSAKPGSVVNERDHTSPPHRGAPAIVFEALTTTEGLTSWWGPDDCPVLSATADVRVGGRFRVRFRVGAGSEHADGASEHECSGEFLEIEAPRRIVMSWQWLSGGDPGERERVSRLELTLIHAELRDDATARSHEWGWGGALDKLTRRLASLGDQVAP